MLINPTQKELQLHLKALTQMSRETEWVEFKTNPDWEMLGKYISALANSAALLDKECAYIVYGVDDATHAVIGTSAHFYGAKHKQQEVESWLQQKLTPKTEFQPFEFVTSDGKPVLLIQIPAANHVPIKFDGVEWIRVGSYTKRLQEFPEKERQLWRSFDRKPFESHVAATMLSGNQVFELLSDADYLRCMSLQRPKTEEALLDRMSQDRLLIKEVNGLYSITNLGAICFAKKLSSFPSLSRKAFRIVKYVEGNRLHAEKEFIWDQGYAVDFEGLIRLIKALLPSQEIIGDALRREVTMYPDIIIRELIPNALIHQDFRIPGSGPMLEIFKNRIEIFNPGIPLVETSRFIDSPPRSRNENLASLMRRIYICEERGSGIDKVVAATEEALLPAPDFEVTSGNFKVVLCARKAFKDYSSQEKLQICYQHCVLKYVNHKPMTNATLRQRLGIETKNSAAVSRIIKDALSKQLIKLYDPEAGPRLRRYIPFWA